MDEIKSTLTKWMAIAGTFAADSSKLYASVRDKNIDVHSEQSPVFEVCCDDDDDDDDDTYSLTHSFIHSLTHSLTHSL